MVILAFEKIGIWRAKGCPPLLYDMVVAEKMVKM